MPNLDYLTLFAICLWVVKLLTIAKLYSSLGSCFSDVGAKVSGA